MIEIVRGCLAARMTKIAKRGQNYLKILLGKVRVRFSGVGTWTPREKTWEGLHSCISDLMASICDKKDLFLFEIYHRQIFIK